MSRRVAFPFFTLTEDAVQAEPWALALNGADFAIARDHLADWDAASTIQARRRLCIDFELAAAETGVGASDLHLSVVASVGTGSGHLPRHVQVCQLLEINESNPAVELAFDLPTLSMVIHLMTDVTLARVAVERDELAPRDLGDRLWSQHQKVRLEGQELRFPIEVADLSGALGDPTLESAPWFAQWNRTDWTRDFHGAFRLFLNSRIQETIEGGSGLVLQAMMADVMSQLCEGLLKEEDPSAEDILTACDQASMAAQVRRWLELAWPSRDLDFVRSVLENTPNRFRAALLALARLDS